MYVPTREGLVGELMTTTDVQQSSPSWLQSVLDKARIQVALAQGIRDESKLTNLVFFARHPERRGRRLERGDPRFQELRKDWLDIRNRLVRPALQAHSARHAPGTQPDRTRRHRWQMDTPEKRAFLERVLNAHLARSTRRRGPPLRDLRGAELKKVPGTDRWMRSDAAIAAGRLLVAANQDLQAAKAEGDPGALKTIRLSATSGYRDRAYQEQLWRKYFVTRYYADTAAHRAGLPGGKHGDEAVKYMVGYVSPKIAAPGFSRHQAGLAIDFKQERTKGNEIKNSTEPWRVKKWQDTWFFDWLGRNAARFHFRPYPREPWHWTFEPPS